MRQDALSAVSRLLRGDSRGAKAGPSSSPITWRNRLQMPREKDALFREDTLREASEVVSQRFQRECSVADVQRKLTALGERWQRIEKMKSLGSASWDHATRTISMREEDYQQYSMVMGRCPF